MVSKIRSVYALVAVGALYLGGCASPATAKGMTITPNDITGPAPAEMAKSVVVEDIVGGRATNSADTSKIDNASFKEALHRSLELAGLLGDAGARYKVAAAVIKVDQPYSFLGLDRTASSKIRYRVTDAKTGALVLDEEISGTDTAHVRDAGTSGARLRIATERSARKTIVTLIEKLKKTQPAAQTAQRSRANQS